MAQFDPHSFADSTQARARHLDWTMDVDFDRRVIDGEVRLRLVEPAGGGPLDLDSKGLTIHSVVADTGVKIPHQVGSEDAILGRRIRLEPPIGTRSIAIRYSTSPEAIALQWLDRAQTEGKKHPFLFSQCQAIHARTMVPVQDTPAFRVTYSARVTVPEALAVVMSAGPAGVEPGPRPGTRTFLFEMPQPIPPYLIALAAGDLASRDLSARARVWAEPGTVDRAAWEFAEVEDMIVRAEALFGPYEWDRYDMLVLPPSFPYGGMENPRMTFLTPTLLAGDRSLVDVVAHELAHSWTGNLVTNANQEHFWLNEGFTVWAERRIVEAIHGESRVALQWAIGGRDLEIALESFHNRPELTLLRQHLSGIDPDDAFSTVPYEKGARFLTLLERYVGRARFDQFVRAYIARFRFTSITTEDFMAFVEENFPGASGAVGASAWLDGPNLPANVPLFHAPALDQLAAAAAGFGNGQRPDPLAMKAWSPAELVVFLQRLPRTMKASELAWLDGELALLARGNYEILVEFLAIAAGSDWEPSFARIREVLTHVGRMKYLRPLYAALGRTERTRALAREIFAGASAGYHGLSRRVVEGILAKYEHPG